MFFIGQRAEISLSFRRARGLICLFLSDQRRTLLLHLHYSAHPLRIISDIDVQLVQRRLCYTADLWLSEKDKDWHDPLLITIRDKTTRNWRGRKTRKACIQKCKAARQRKTELLSRLRLFMKRRKDSGLRPEVPGRQRQALGFVFLAWSRRRSNSHA